MASIAYCQKADLIYEGGWGGTVENYDKCGETLLECQSEGSSSSVGEDEQSSSSQELLSSDSHYSSFDAESSSSEEFGPESSDSGINSSSSDDGDNPSSSSGDEECGSGIGHCPLKEDTLGRNSPYDEIKCTYSKTPYLYDLAGTGECVTKWVETANSSRKKNTQNAFVPPTLDPHDLNKMAFHFNCPQSIGLLSIPNENYNHLVVYSNIPYARTTGQFNDFYCYRTLEDCLLEKNEILMTRPEGFWCAPDYASDGYTTMTDYGCSIIHPYENKTVLSGVNFHYTNEEGFSIYKLNGVLLSNTTEDLLFNKIRDAAKNAEMTISFLDDGTSVYPDIEAMDEACAKWQKRGDYNQSSSSEMESSSSEVKSSSSEELSSSSEESSSSVEESSSSYECSSSDCDDGISSSSQEEFSSSSDELVSSGSVDVEESSSSQQIESSSSEFVYSSSSDGHFVSGGDQVHSPDQIFNDGLDNMEPGSCYSLNPDRGTQYGWMNTDAQDSWWWREVDCESGEKVDRNRVGACPGFPLDNVPSNPKRTCVAYNGRCYRCKSENSYVDCSQEWLWKWSFSEQNIGSWYAEVDCYNPRYEGNVAGCLESKGLYKASIGFDNIVDGFDDVVEISSSKKYDAKGRMIYIGNETRNKMPQYRKVIKKELVTGIYSLKDNLQMLSFVMVHGHVKASIKVLLVEDRILERIGNAYNHLCKMRIITNVEEVYYSDEIYEIIQHEKEHERIYRTLEFVEWSENVSVQSSTVENQCEELKKLLWNKAKKKIEKMLNAQNEWDDSDPKNECKDRIDVKKELKKLEDEFYSTIPCYPCTVNENR